MPTCVVKWCKNNSTLQNKSQGITFHKFPSGNEKWKDSWIRIIRNCRGQEDWSPSKSSVVCSIHFDQNDFYTTSKGRRRLVPYHAVPKLVPAREKGDNTAEWNEFELALIAAVKKNPILYKQNYLRAEVSDSYWEAIAKEVGKPKHNCIRKWSQLKNCYARLKQSGLQGTRYDSTLSFLDPELDEIQRRSWARNTDLDQEIPTKQPKNTTVIPLLASDDDESADLEDLIISQHISTNPEDNLPPEKQLHLGHSIGIQSPSSPSDPVTPHLKGSSLKPRTDVHDLHSVEISKKIHSIKERDDEKQETLINPNKPKRFKSCSSSIGSDTIMANLSNEGITRQPIAEESRITVLGSHSVEINRTHQRPFIFETITLEDSDAGDSPLNARFEPNSTSLHSKTSTITNMSNKDIAPGILDFGSHSVEINKTYQCPETFNCIKLEDSDTDDIPTGSRCEPDSAEYAHMNTSTITNSPKNDMEYNPILSLKTELPTDESCKNVKSFFTDLSSYIKSKFSLKKQKEIQSRIFSLLISEERRRHEDQAK